MLPNFFFLQEDPPSFPPGYPVGTVTSYSIDVGFVLLCAAMVFLMRVGFLFLELGTIPMSQEQRNAHVNMKLMESVATTIGFTLFGYGVSYFVSENSVISLLIGNPVDHLRTLFGQEYEPFYLTTQHFEFCLNLAHNSATIVAGAVATRINPTAYICFAFFMASFLQPVAGYWVWSSAGWATANDHEDGSPGLFGTNGMIDYAGAVVVHMVGGVAALTAAWMVGKSQAVPFGPTVNPIQEIGVRDMTQGAMIIWFGWYGFNMGSMGGLSGNKFGQVALIAQGLTFTASIAVLFMYVLQILFSVREPKPKLQASVGGLSAHEKKTEFNLRWDSFKRRVKFIGHAYIRCNMAEQLLLFVKKTSLASVATNDQRQPQQAELPWQAPTQNEFQNFLKNFEKAVKTLKDELDSEILTETSVTDALQALETLIGRGVSLGTEPKCLYNIIPPSMITLLQGWEQKGQVFMNIPLADLYYFCHLTPENWVFDTRNSKRAAWGTLPLLSETDAARLTDADKSILHGWTVEEWASHQRSQHWRGHWRSSARYTLEPDRTDSLIHETIEVNASMFSVPVVPVLGNGNAPAQREVSTLVLHFTLDAEVQYGELINALIVSLVAVTAGGHLFPPWMAVVVAPTSVVFYLFGVWLEDNKFKVTDPLRAFPVHGMGGLAGAFLAGFAACTNFGTQERFLYAYDHNNFCSGSECWKQVLLNIGVALAIAAWTFSCSYIFFKLWDVVDKLKAPYWLLDYAKYVPVMQNVLEDASQEAMTGGLSSIVSSLTQRMRSIFTQFSAVITPAPQGTQALPQPPSQRNVVDGNNLNFNPSINGPAADLTRLLPNQQTNNADDGRGVGGTPNESDQD